MRITDYPHCTCSPEVEDGETPVCEHCFIQGARSAGIPDSVIEGRTRLSDHFSADYIDFQRDPKGNIERGLAAGRAVKAGHDPEDYE